MKLGKAIKRLREEKDIKQGKLAKAVGIGSSWMSQIESGHKQPSKELTDKICDELGIDLKTLAIYCMKKKHVEKQKKELYDLLKPKVDALILEIVKAG